MCEQVDGQQDKVNVSLVECLSETMQWNRSGIKSMQNNDIEQSLDLFSKAFNKHEKSKSSIMAKMGVSSIGERPATALISSGNHENIGKGMGDWFMRDLPCVPSTSGIEDEESSEEMMHCEPIRLPANVDGIASRMDSAYNSGDRSVEDPALDALSLLSICHAYNLGLAHHLCGTKILHSTTNTSPLVPDADTHFKEAGRMFEFTLRMERLRSQNSQQQHTSNHLRHQEETNGARLIIVLACLSNLGDLYYKCNEASRSRQCYKKLKMSSEQLQGILSPGRNHPDERLLRLYLPSFRAKSQKGLALVSRSGNSSNSPARTPSPTPTQSLYVFSSSTAGAA